MGVVNQPTYLTVNGTQMSGGVIDLTIPGGTADPNTGEITFPAASSSGVTQSFTLTNTDITNKYLLVSTDITNDTSTKFEIEGLAPQYYSTDFEVDGTNKKKVKWIGLGLELLLESGDKVHITYS
jgi:hypothetical protein